jgi:DDE superfamily endonuclease
MEDVLDVYTRPYDPLRPQICMDETSKQLLRDAKEPLPMEPGTEERRDYEYERGGVVNLFLFCEPLQGRRWVDVTQRRTKTDWAHQIKELVDERYPEAEQIVLVMDNLTIPTPQPHSMRLSIPRRQGASPTSLRSTTPPSTAVGSTWPRSN